MWFRLPLVFRLFFVVVLVVSSLTSFFWQSSLYYFLGGLFILFGVGSGAFRFKRFHIWASGGLVLFAAVSLAMNARYGRPNGGIISFLPSIALTMITVLVVTQGVKVEDLLLVFRRLPVIIKSILIAIPSSWSSIMTDFFHTRLSFKLSRSASWLEKRSLPQKFGALYEFFVIFAIIIGNTYDSMFKNWKHSKVWHHKLATLKPHDVYSLKYFPAIYDYLFSSNGISGEWKELLERYLRNKQNILEIGAGGGKLTSWLLGEKFNLAMSLEPNENLLNIANGKVREYNFSVSNGTFPEAIEKGKKFDAIVMHQNVFMELINQIEIKDLLNVLKEISSTDSCLLFDYPMNPAVPKKGETKTLFSGEIPQVGQVRYGFKYIGSDQNEGYQALLSCEICDINKVSTRYSYKMSIDFPTIVELAESIRAAGIMVKELRETSFFSFFSEKLGVFVLEPNGRS